MNYATARPVLPIMKCADYLNVIRTRHAAVPTCVNILCSIEILARPALPIMKCADCLNVIRLCTSMETN